MPKTINREQIWKFVQKSFRKMREEERRRMTGFTNYFSNNIVAQDFDLKIGGSSEDFPVAYEIDSYGNPTPVRIYETDEEYDKTLEKDKPIRYRERWDAMERMR